MKKTIATGIALLFATSVFASTNFTAFLRNNSPSYVNFTVTSTDNLITGPEIGKTYAIEPGQLVTLDNYVKKDKVGHLHFIIDNGDICTIRMRANNSKQLSMNGCTGTLSHLNGIETHQGWIMLSLF